MSSPSSHPPWGHRPWLGIPSATGDRPPRSPHHHPRQWPGWVCSCWSPCPTGADPVGPSGSPVEFSGLFPTEDGKCGNSMEFRLKCRDYLIVVNSWWITLYYISIHLYVFRYCVHVHNHDNMATLYKIHIQSYKMYWVSVQYVYICKKKHIICSK